MGFKDSIRRADEWDGCFLTLPADTLIEDMMMQDGKKKSPNKRQVPLYERIFWHIVLRVFPFRMGRCCAKEEHISWKNRIALAIGVISLPLRACMAPCWFILQCLDKLLDVVKRLGMPIFDLIIMPFRLAAFLLRVVLWLVDSLLLCVDICSCPDCKLEHLTRAASLIASDIRTKVKTGGECKALLELAQLLDPESKCYEGTTSVATFILVIGDFQREGGFSSLAEYLSKRLQGSRRLPSITVLTRLIDGVRYVSRERVFGQNEPKSLMVAYSARLVERKKDAALVSQVIFDYTKTLSFERQPHDILQVMLHLADTPHLSSQREFQEFYQQLVLDAWNMYTRGDGWFVSSSQVGSSLAYSCRRCLPRLASFQVVELLKRDYSAERKKVKIFCIQVSSLKLPQSDEVRSAMQQLFWRLRVDHAYLRDSSDEKYKQWLKFEMLCSMKWKNSGSDRREEFEPQGDMAPPRKPIVSVLDPKSRRIQVSIPLESEDGELFVGMQVFASCGSQEDKEISIGSISKHTIDDCLKENADKVSVEAILPYHDTYEIECHGLLRRRAIVKTPRSTKAVVDLTTHIVNEEKRRRARIDEKDEMARKCAGDIHSVLQKLRGPCSNQMDIETKFTMLDTAVVCGHSTLGDLTSLVEAHGEDKEAVLGISKLASALATALPAHAELEADFKTHSQKGNSKSFKVHLTAHVESGDVAAWLAKVTAQQLQGLGGDPNRLYQCLVEGKGGSKSKSLEQDAAVLAAASMRTDLFSKKQIKELVQRKVQMGGQVSRAAAPMKSGPTKSAAASAALASKTKKWPKMAKPAKAPLKVSSTAVTTKAAQQSNKPRVVTPKSKKLADTSLLTFLKEQATCLKGSPQDFYRFLVDTQGIKTLNGLASAVADADYFQNVIQPGNGTVGIKGFKRAVFANAVRRASKASFNNDDDGDDDKENVAPSAPSSQLTCPISLILMTKDPVIAADGKTYERSAIETCFQEQSAQIEAALRDLASGRNASKAQTIIERGVVSPVTTEKMRHLNLVSNKSVRTVARKAAKQKAVLGDCTN